LISHPWVNILAGKKAYAPMQQEAGEWSLGNPDAALPHDVEAALEDRKFSIVITGQDYGSKAIWDRFFKVLTSHYRHAGNLPDFMGIERVDGIPMTPREIWIPK
ncbi:MAG: hypothetical protein AB7H77_06350, partial [Bdellovibrionales bacterium]